ncbi:MAG: hypothetical protein WBO45_18735 [Planctomycetota bacterium]
MAPKPVVPSMSTRRAFLLAGSTFVAGAAIAGACGYAAGVKSAGGGGAAAAKEAELDLAAGLAPTGDPDLDELRSWAIKSPIDELESHIQIFMEQVRSTYTSDAYLWHGMERLVNRVLRREHTQWPRLCKQVLTQIIELADPRVLPENGRRLQSRLPEMKKVR